MSVVFFFSVNFFSFIASRLVPLTGNLKKNVVIKLEKSSLH